MIEIAAWLVFLAFIVWGLIVLLALVVHVFNKCVDWMMR